MFLHQHLCVMHLKYYYVVCDALIPHEHTNRVHLHLIPMRFSVLAVSWNLQPKVGP
jgi:hypothetical protein